jgi:NADPH:quinone reductase-like Zn-dependent oxidoreductase
MMMQAASYATFGKAGDVLVVGSREAPVAGAGEVLVRLATSGVNPSDVKKRAGSQPAALAGGDLVPHSDGAGTIVAVGEGVDPARIGERVWTYQAHFQRRFGTAAQYVALESRRAVRLPHNASFAVGACLGIPVMTAHRCVFADGSVAGQLVLVTGGAGRVGRYAIQFAKHAGATVIATASNAADAAECRELGAAEVVNHRESGWGKHVAAWAAAQRAAGKVDRVVDVEFGANLPEVLDCLRVGGTIATYSSTQVTEPKLPFFRMLYMDVTLRIVIVYAMPEEAKQAAIADITRDLAADRLHHRIAAEVPLAEIAHAHELIEQGRVRGCVLINLPE